MVIDVHMHPVFFKDICEDSSRLNFRKEQYGLFKAGPQTLEETITRMDWSGVDKTILLPQHLTTLYGDTVISNEEVKTIVDLAPDRFIGFASVDPHRDDAVEILDHAFKNLGLKGLKLNPSKQKFYPNDEKLKHIYEKCIEYNRPIMFHSGMSWEPNTPVKYSHPLNFEEVAINYPELRMCLAHFGWPYVDDTVMLLLKYPNIYTDTSILPMDSPKDFYEQVFTKTMATSWIDSNLNNKVMFGSNGPRFRAAKLKPALEELKFRPTTVQKIFGLNAMKFLGLEE